MRGMSHSKPRFTVPSACLTCLLVATATCTQQSMPEAVHAVVSVRCRVPWHVEPGVKLGVFPNEPYNG